MFRQLTKDDVVKILDIEVEKIKSRLAQKKIDLHLSDAAKEFLIGKGYDPQYGARPMRRAVERFLEDPLAEEILKGHIHKDEVVDVTVEEDRLRFGQLAGAS